MSTRPIYIYEQFPDDIRAEETAIKEAKLVGEEYQPPKPPHEFDY